MTMKGKNDRNNCAASVSVISGATVRHHQCKAKTNRKNARTNFLRGHGSKRSLRPCQAYLGENFAVKLFNNFKFQRAIENENETGLVYCQYKSLRNFHEMNLSNLGRRLLDCPNAGGSSVESEVLSYELFHRCYGAHLLKTEMEVGYFPEGGSITDYTCEMYGIMLGISVTRAMKYKGEFTLEDASKLLNKKMNGIINSSQNTLEKWSKQILHVWATSHQVANMVTRAYAQLASQLKSNTVVYITVVAKAESTAIFRNA